MDAYGASPSSSSIPTKYDVFLSFRGEDTRNNITSHLYAALKRKKIETYIDEKSLERGDDITVALPEAIQKSKISIIVFSKNYASSSWCLRELEQILKHRRANKQIAIPIFYDVDPSHIRKQEGSYGEAFLKHQERFKDKMDVVEKWRAALTESSDLSGWDSQATRPESELVAAVVEDVMRKLGHIPSSDNDRKDLIGITEHIQNVELMLSVGSPDVRVVGIWGLGGIGKTALADFVFNKHCYEFESSCFLANVREESEKHGLINLRDKLLSKLLEESMNLGTPSLPPHVKDRLCRQKVFIVLDDVNDSEQLQVLVGGRDLFGLESRIIVTTRDAKVLKDTEADGTYEVKPLNYDEALQLFELKAFRGNSPATDYIELSKEVVKYAGGIPLAINILASHLRSLYPKSIADWEMTLKSLKEVSNDDIEKKLRISYNGLSKKEQSIFLDIACFFKSEHIERVENILNACGFSASILINNLIDKCLITSNGGTLGMHDLVQAMGWSIVQQESEEQPGQQTRLWIAKDAYRVLNNNKGTKKIEGIFLDMAKIDKELHLRPEVFEKMSKLRLLKIYNTIIFDDCGNVKRNKVRLRQDLESLPHTLRYLHWEGYSSKHLPSDFEPENLVEINMPYSQLEQLPDEIQDSSDLKSIDLQCSDRLTQLPDFSDSSKVEKINVSHCSKLQTLPMIMTRSLTYLSLSSTAIEYLPSSICSLNNLTELYLGDCKRLVHLPSSMTKLDSLLFLELKGCSDLKSFPELPWNIFVLDISGTAIKKVASRKIKGRVDLRKIDLRDCKSLESLPSNMFRLKSLADLNLGGCSNLEKLPEILEPVESLRELNLQGTGIRQLPSSIGNLIGVVTLDMGGCQNLEFIPGSISNMVNLTEFTLSNCPELEYFPMYGYAPSVLKSLYLSNSNITKIPECIKRFSKLEMVYIRNCKNLSSLPEFPLSLKLLDATGCVSLEVALNPRRAFTLEFWDVNHSTEWPWETLMFRDCPNLNQNERLNIISEFQLRVLRMAQQLVPRGIPIGTIAPVARACCPGNEIPKWFESQSDGSEMNIKLPRGWNNSDFLGVIVCAVGDSYSDVTRWDLACEFKLIPNQGQGEVQKFIWPFGTPGPEEREFPSSSNTSHLYMWYKYQDYHQCLDAEEASFRFYFVDFSYDVFDWIETSKYPVYKCGIRMLYRQDLDELIESTNQHLLLEKPDAIIDNPESSIDKILEIPCTPIKVSPPQQWILV